MDKVSIGLNAGVVWRLIHNRGTVMRYSKLKEASGLSDRNLNAAIGWLARENKIEFGTDPEDNAELYFVELNIYF